MKLRGLPATINFHSILDFLSVFRFNLVFVLIHLLIGFSLLKFHTAFICVIEFPTLEEFDLRIRILIIIDLWFTLRL